MVWNFRYHSRDRLKNGDLVTMRLVGPDDDGRPAALLPNHEPRTLRARLLASEAAPAGAGAGRTVAIDSPFRFLLLATADARDGQVEIGGGRCHPYELSDGRRSAEVAFLVEESYRRLGVASRLLVHVAVVAAHQGIDRLEASVMASDQAMLKVFERSRLPLHRHQDGDTIRIALELPG
jgi:GNAT superfamily N-acetyltransferase